jgi:hypothetical protein
MEIKNVLIDLHVGYANSPSIIVEIDDGVPYHFDFSYEKRGSLYWGELNGFVCFFSHNIIDQQGYGGILFDLRMLDGTVEHLLGPWSSRSGVMNKAGFPHSKEVSFMNEKGLVEGHILVSELEQFVNLNQKIGYNGEIEYNVDCRAKR